MLILNFIMGEMELLMMIANYDHYSCREVLKVIPSLDCARVAIICSGNILHVFRHPFQNSPFQGVE